MRPNPYVVVAREDIQIHLFGLDEFDPELSTGNVIVAVPDPTRCTSRSPMISVAPSASSRRRHPAHPAAGLDDAEPAHAQL